VEAGLVTTLKESANVELLVARLDRRQGGFDGFEGSRFH